MDISIEAMSTATSGIDGMVSVDSHPPSQSQATVSGPVEDSSNLPHASSSESRSVDLSTESGDSMAVQLRAPSRHQPPSGNISVKVKTKEACQSLAGQEVKILGGRSRFQ